MHTQNLRESPNDIASYFTHWRGWFKRWQWEFCFRKNIFESLIKFELDLGGSDDPGEVQITLGLLGLSVYLTFHNLLPKRWHIGWFERGGVRNPRQFEDGLGRCWGFYYLDKSFVVMWNHTNGCSGKDKRLYGHTWHFYVPWQFEHVRSSVVNTKGELEPQKYSWDKNGEDDRKIYKDSYVYRLKSGELQFRTATYFVGEMEWRWRFFTNYLKIKSFGPKKIRRSIDVTFDKEVGEGSGSWKGGCTGCGYELLPDEGPLTCLRRMERERKF